MNEMMILEKLDYNRKYTEDRIRCALGTVASIIGGTIIVLSFGAFVAITAGFVIAVFGIALVVSSIRSTNKLKIWAKARGEFWTREYFRELSESVQRDQKSAN
ncbi:hypothetical protein A2707_00880 [Candidatus Saccharibacteria bacterium RIFCSPHIGHO2_01_FULL_45_15]|nr:MAG: hypothetical protein A2707_00880 [Candidatus Saccharibacteria bacterium RIFCSPHIGHO2_01_FULL_45_15]OGL26926.1 MAG: hypothetical protein A3C39_01995 [Candidatus Saccharibacteria bacterium RIFCSPHIGHO2_02_FULL_46_12]OGL32279.1 MAG: hypothetical protein A3E76_02700 [Candidatus Saccharibacteria bacterium RIFCSPHIGHO2_12_FULL_44_22]